MALAQNEMGMRTEKPNKERQHRAYTGIYWHIIFFNSSNSGHLHCSKHVTGVTRESSHGARDSYVQCVAGDEYVTTVVYSTATPCKANVQ